jgi:hypothetical protein
VENGSLETWLRRTPAGKSYVPPHKRALMNPGNQAGLSEREVRSTL